MVYTDIEEGGKVLKGSDYIKRAEATCAERIAMGGFRLQGVLEKAYESLKEMDRNGGVPVDVDKVGGNGGNPQDGNEPMEVKVKVGGLLAPSEVKGEEKGESVFV